MHAVCYMVAPCMQAAGTLEDSASALHGPPEQELEACSLPELLPNGEDGSLVDGSITDILEPSMVESSGVGSRVSGTAPGRDAAVARMQTWRRSAASPVPEGAEGSAEASGHEEDVADGTISDILSSHMSELTMSSTSSRTHGQLHHRWHCITPTQVIVQAAPCLWTCAAPGRKGIRSSAPVTPAQQGYLLIRDKQMM